MFIWSVFLKMHKEVIKRPNAVFGRFWRLNGKFCTFCTGGVNTQLTVDGPQFPKLDCSRNLEGGTVLRI